MTKTGGLAVAALFLLACASPCFWQAGSCLDLIVEGEGSAPSLEVSLATETGTSQIGAVPHEVRLPIRLRVTPPPGVLSSIVRSISVRGNVEGQAQQAKVDLSWPEGAHVEARILLGPASVPPPDLGAAGDLTPDPALRFMQPQSIEEPGLRAELLAVADFGRGVEIAVVFAMDVDLKIGRLALLKRQGDGKVVEQMSLGEVSRPSKLIAGDVDGDTRADLLVQSREEGAVVRLLNQGGGLRRDPPAMFLASPAAALVSDGHLFVLGAPPASGKLHVFKNRAPLGEIEVPAEPVALRAGDLDGVGGVDLVSAHRRGGIHRYLRRDGAKVEPAGPIGGCQDARDVSVGALDDDRSADDVAIACASDESIEIVRQAGTLRFPRLMPSLLAKADFNGDQIDDIAVLQKGSFVTVLLSGGGGFTPLTWPVPFPLSGAIEAADLNQDGRPDLVLSAQGWLYLLMNQWP